MAGNGNQKIKIHSVAQKNSMLPFILLPATSIIVK